MSAGRTPPPAAAEFNDVQMQMQGQSTLSSSVGTDGGQSTTWMQAQTWGFINQF
ncbi:MAG TPA: hypothetical protein VN931_03580 [Fibrobacteria bacterium]|nr:hypothetical protein [Fibrobacteria bacterium]